MGLFARKNSGVDDEAVQTSDIPDGSQQPAIVESQRSRMTLRKRPKDNTQVYTYCTSRRLHLLTSTAVNMLAVSAPGTCTRRA